MTNNYMVAEVYIVQYIVVALKSLPIGQYTV